MHPSHDKHLLTDRLFFKSGSQLYREIRPASYYAKVKHQGVNIPTFFSKRKAGKATSL